METKIIQFGEGNFLRAYFDWMVEKMNAKAGFGGSVAVVQPRGDALKAPGQAINAQGGRYHVCVRGIENGETVERIEEITCVEGVSTEKEIERLAVIPSVRFVVSNTTEAGIQYVKGENTFPAKALRLVKARHAAGLPGVVFLPCELVPDNGPLLKECMLKHLADDPVPGLAEYIERECVFCSTLVDRIVSGAPDAESAARFERELGKRDAALVCCEPFHFLAVQPPDGFDLEKEMPLKAAGINVVQAADIGPYRTRKVRFLNATHTSMVYWALERGFTEVAETLASPEGGAFVRKVLFEEIFPTVPLPDGEKKAFAETVLERFANPFAHHKLASIALNTVAKWKARCLPVVCDYYKATGRFPEAMMQGYDAIARHYDSLR